MIDHFHRLLDQMGRNGHCPDIHTFNVLLHVLGKGDKLSKAHEIINDMIKKGQYIHRISRFKKYRKH